VRLFTKQTQIIPDAPRAWANLGGALQSAGRYEDSVVALRRSLAIEETRGGWVNLGNVYFWLGRYSEAASAYEKAAALQPKQYVAWYNLGEAYRWAPGQRSKSIEPYKKAMELARESLTVNPNDAATRALVASCLAKTGDVGGAQTELNMALRQDPTNSRALYQAAVIASIRGDRDAARAWLQRAIAAGASLTDAQHDPELASIKPQA